MASSTGSHDGELRAATRPLRPAPRFHGRSRGNTLGRSGATASKLGQVDPRGGSAQRADRTLQRRSPASSGAASMFAGTFRRLVSTMVRRRGFSCTTTWTAGSGNAGASPRKLSHWPSMCSGRRAGRVVLSCAAIDDAVQRASPRSLGRRAGSYGGAEHLPGRVDAGHINPRRAIRTYGACSSRRRWPRLTVTRTAKGPNRNRLGSSPPHLYFVAHIERTPRWTTAEALRMRISNGRRSFGALGAPARDGTAMYRRNAPNAFRRASTLPASSIEHI